jgi:hypothetical protein
MRLSHSAVSEYPDAEPMTESIPHSGHNAVNSPSCSAVQREIRDGGQMLRQKKQPQSLLARTSL